MPIGVVFAGSVIKPNSPGPAEIFELGCPNWARLKILKASARNCIRNRSVNKNCFPAPKSSCQRLGPKKMSRPALPQVPAAGTVNAAKLIQLAVVEPPTGVKETPGTKSGRWLLVLPSGTELADRLTRMLMGKPV